MVEKHKNDRKIAQYACGLLHGSEAAAVEAHIARSKRAQKVLKLFEARLNTAQIHNTPGRDAMLEALVAHKAREEQRRDSILRPAFSQPYRKPLAALAALAAAAVALLLILPPAAPGPLTLHVAALTGEAADQENTALTPGMDINPGSTIYTAADSSVHLKLAAGSISLQAHTSLAFADAARDEDRREAHWRFALDTGTLIADVDSTAVASLAVQLPAGAITVLGTRFAVSVTEQHSSLYVAQGTVQLSLDDTDEAPHIAGEHELLTISPEGITPVPAPKAVIEAGEAISTDVIATLVEESAAAASVQHKTQQEAQTRSTFQERLILTDGTILTGRIISQTEDAITFNSQFGTMTIPRTRIQRVEYTR